jgi:hypothetical protein
MDNEAAMVFQSNPARPAPVPCISESGPWYLSIGGCQVNIKKQSSKIKKKISALHTLVT